MCEFHEPYPDKNKEKKENYIETPERTLNIYKHLKELKLLD